MSVEISNIQNEVLRLAAVVADLNDNTANSGKLDQKELPVFIREAVKSDCNMAEIIEVCNQVGVEHATDDVKASMEKLNQLQKLEKELEYQNNILKNENYKIKKIKQQAHNSYSKEELITTSTSVGGFIIGGLICALIGALSGAKFRISNEEKAIQAMTGLVGGGLGGFMIGDRIGDRIVQHLWPEEPNAGSIDDYEDHARSIYQNVEKLKNQMKEIENSL